MDKKQRNKSKMYRTVYQMMIDQKSVWEETPQLVETVNKLKQLIDVIYEKREVQESITLDAGKMKSDAREQLADLSLKGGKLMNSLSKSENDLETVALLITTKSGLTILDSMKFLAYAERLDKLMETRLDALAPMGWDESVQKAFAEALQTFHEQVVFPRHKTVLRSQATQELKWLFEEVDNLLKDDLDAMVEVLETKSPEFLNAYENARKFTDPYQSKPIEEDSFELDDEEDDLEEGDTFNGY